ncbi:GntR family transcriptional regulator [Trujillonella humicola]|uniref:GntR family transcriptional regulator n=1 Tax=Trujillonella humicola TaxID=3383699 RepID=UPI003906BAA1
MTGDRGGQPPLYRQVRQVLAGRIAAGEYRAGDRLPSEPVLAAELDVHRLTVRRALDELAREGLLHARQGAGTFVTPRPAPIAVTIPLSREEFSTSLRAQLEAEGRHYRDVLVSTEIADDDAVRADLRHPRGPLRRVDSRLEVNGETWVSSTAWGPDDRLADLATQWRETDGVYGLLLDRSAGPLHHVWRSFGAEAAGAQDAERLGVRIGAPVLVREGLTADADGTPVLRVRRCARGDRVRYVLSYDGEAAPGSAG